MGDMEDIEWLEVVSGGKSQPEEWFDDEMASRGREPTWLETETGDKEIQWSESKNKETAAAGDPEVEWLGETRKTSESWLPPSKEVEAGGGGGGDHIGPQWFEASVDDLGQLEIFDLPPALDVHVQVTGEAGFGGQAAHHLPHQQQGAPGANIDLGAVYQNTVENRVTRTFSQHWIIVGKHLRVLLLDFDGKFTLLIPNIELGKAFRINKADVEVTCNKWLSSPTPWWSQVQTKELEGGHKLTFMKFTFQSPALEIKAPVLNDKTVGYQVLQQNGACVFLSRIFNIPPGGPGGPGVPQAPGNPRHPFPEARSGGYVAPHTGGPPGWTNGPSHYPTSHPSTPTLAALNSPSMNSLNSPSMALNSPSPASQSSNSHLAAAMMGAAGRRGSTPQPMLRHPLQSPSQQQQQMMQQSPSQQQQQMQMQSPQSMLQSPQTMMQQSPQQQHMMQSPQQPMLQQPSPSNMLQSPPSNMLQSPQSFPHASPQPLEPLAPSSTAYSPSVPVSAQPPVQQPPPTIAPPPPAVERKPVNFFELYSALNKEEYDKMTTCSFCQRKFRFTSVLLEHLRTHTSSVNNIVEMKMKIWVNGRKLKCTEKGCKKKHAYTLEYTKHRDEHTYIGLNCAICNRPQPGPADYAAHMAAEHPTELSLQETQPEDVAPPPAPPSFPAPSTSTPSPSPATTEAGGQVCSPAMFHPTSSQEGFQQVHTPMSAPPIMMASPAGLLPPPSPQQPMSAPSSVQFSEADHMDFVAINNITNNMPILDQTVQDPINKESEEFMSILNDLQKDCNQDFGNNQQPQQPQQQQQQLGPVHHQQQQPPQQPSNAQIMDGLLKEQENQEFFDNNIDKIDDVMDGNKIVENKLNDMRSAEGGEDFASPGPHPIILSPRFSPKPNPTQESETQLAEQPSFQQFPTSLYQQQPNQSPGVIVSRPQHQEQQHLQQQQQEEQKAVQQLLDHDNDISLQQSEPSFPFENGNTSDQQGLSNGLEPAAIQQRLHSETEPAMLGRSNISQSVQDTERSSNKVAQPDEQTKHASPSVRAIVANKILQRNRSLSDSIDSRRSEPWSPAPGTPPRTPGGPPDHQPGQQHHFQPSDQLASMCEMVDEERETSPSPPPPAPPTPEPVPSQPAADADRPKCDMCGKSFGSKAAIASHVKVCEAGAQGVSGTGGERSDEACAEPHSVEAPPAISSCGHQDATNTALGDDEPAPCENSEAGDRCVEMAVKEPAVVNEELRPKSEMESQSHQREKEAAERRVMESDVKVQERESEYTFQEDGDEEPKDSNTVTPVKSWLKKHLDSVKVPENTGNRRASEKSQPLYIIPQEPEERVVSSGVSSSEDEDSPVKRTKKSPRGWGRQRKESNVDHGPSKDNYDTKQAGLKVKFSKNADPDYSKTINPSTGYSYRPDTVVKKKGRPKGVKNKGPKKMKQAKTPKKIMLQKTQSVPQPPNKNPPSKQTTPSPPLSTTSPTASLSFGLAPALGPALDDLSRPKSKSPENLKVRRLSESSSSGNGSSSDSEPSLDDDIEVVKTVSLVNSASPPRTVARSSFEEAFVKSLEAQKAGAAQIQEEDDNEPILEVCPEKMQGLDENDIVAVATDDDEEMATTSDHPLAFAEGLVGFSRSDRESVESRRMSHSSERSFEPMERSASPSPARSPSPSSSPLARSPSPSSPLARVARSPSRSVRKSSTSSSSSSSASDSSSDESRSSSPAPVQLPIPKLKIKIGSLPNPPSPKLPKSNKNYRAVKVFGENQLGKPTGRQLTTNSLVNKLRSLTCKVDVPRLKFRCRSPDSADEAEVKLHQQDIQVVPRCQTDKTVGRSNIQETPERLQPPIAPIKIRLRSPSESQPAAQTGQSLFSVLDQICTRRPRLKATTSSKQYKDFQLPIPEPRPTEPEVFSSSLTKSLAVLTKFAEAEICHNIVDEIVTKIELRRSICEEILGETIDEIFEEDAIDSHSEDVIKEPADLENEKSVAVVEEEKSDGTDCVEMDEDHVDNVEMDEDSSIELSDSEYDALNVKPIVITPLRNETILPSDEEATKVVLCEPDVIESSDCEKAATKEAQTTQPEEAESDVQQEETVPILKIKNPLKQEKKKKTPIKLTIKPIKQDVVDSDLDLSGCITDSEAEMKNPPIIVKIPKASLSPTKKCPKSPFKSLASADSKLSKTPSVSIKNLKILPFFQPKPTPDSTTPSPDSPVKETKASKSKKHEDRSADLPSKSEKTKSLGKAAKLGFTVTSNKNSDSKVTVLKMSGRSALSRKEEAQEMSERKSDLERMLEEERQRKAEEVKKMKETKKEVPASLVAKKSPAKVMKRKSPSKSVDPELTLDLMTSEGIAKERRSSLSKAREQWVVTTSRVTTPSPTPMPFVAKKSRPDETVSFSLPPGGFKNDPTMGSIACETTAAGKSDSKAKSVPWFASPSVDDLFNQYFNPDADKNTGTESGSNIEDEDEQTKETDQQQTLEVNSSRSVAEGILAEILESISPSPDSRPASSARSRTCSGDSMRSETSSVSSLERRKSPQGQCANQQKAQKSRRKTEDLACQDDLERLNGGYWDAIGVRGVVREKIQRQESLESAEKEKAHNKAEQKKTTKEKRSLSKDSPRKRHRTLSSGKQEAEPGNPARNKKSPTPPRRLKSLDTDLETSKSVKSPLKPSASLENCQIRKPWVVVENAGLDKKIITETWIQNSPSLPPPDSTSFIGEILDDLLLGLQSISKSSPNMSEAKELTEERENVSLGGISVRSSRRKSQANVVCAALDSKENEATTDPTKSEDLKPRALRRRSSAKENSPTATSQKSKEESSEKENSKVLSPRASRRRSQLEEESSGKEATENLEVIQYSLTGRTPSPDSSKAECSVSDEKPSSRLPDTENDTPERNPVTCSVEINNSQSGNGDNRKEDLPSSVSKKRRSNEESSPAKRQRVDQDEAVSDIDPICEDFESYPVHFDEGFLGSTEEENVAPGEVMADSTEVGDKNGEPEQEEKTGMEDTEKVSKLLRNNSDKSEDQEVAKLERNSEIKPIAPHQRIVTRKRSVESPWISSNSEQKSRRKEEKTKESSKTEQQDGPSKEACPLEVEAKPQASAPVVNPGLEEKRAKSRKYQKDGWMTRKPAVENPLKEKEKEEEKRKKEQVFDFEEEPTVSVDPPIGKILELVVDAEDLKENPCLEKDSGNGSERDDDDNVIEDLSDMDYMNLSKDSGGENSDIWNSINEALLDVSKSASQKTEDQDKETKSPEKMDDLDFDLGSGKKGGFDWPEGLAELKDEFADDNADIWASVNEDMNEISITLDVSPLQPKADQKSHERSPSRRSRSKKRRTEENLGNPDSGKENADADIVDGEIEVESKKIEKVLSPVTKRKKDPRTKPSKSSETKSPLPSSSSTPKRQRSLSGSSDESCEESRGGQSGEKSTKPREVGSRVVSSNHRTIQIIEAIPLPNPSDSAGSDKTSGRSKPSPRKVKEVSQSRERMIKAERISQTESRRKEERDSSGKSKSSKKPSTSKSKQDWSLKSPLTKTHPSSLVKYYDTEYDRLTNKPEASKSRRPSK